MPDDIALAGFDDIPIARFVNPPLTTVRVRIADLGRRALERLVAAARHAGDRTHAVRRRNLSCEIVVRASCGNANKSAAGSGNVRTPASITELEILGRRV